MTMEFKVNKLKVVPIFYSIQGEGSGREGASIFIRLYGVT